MAVKGNNLTQRRREAEVAEKVRLGEIVRIDTSVPLPSGKKIWLLNLDMIEQQTGRIIDRVLVDRETIGGSTVAFDQECILYSKLRPNLNKVVLPSCQGVATSEILPLRCNTKCSSRGYVCWFLRSPTFVSYAISRTAGAKMPRLGSKELLSATIPLPPLPEQKRIAATLDKICELKKNAETRRAKLDLLVKSRFVEMFGDVCRNSKHFPLLRGKEAFTFSSGKFLESEKRKTSGVPVYGGNGIAWYTDYPLVCKPTIVLGRVGAYCGNARLVTQPAWITDNAIYIKDFRRNDFDIVFLAYYMQVLNFAKYAAKSGQPKITQRPLEATCYVIPPVHLQRKFAAFVEKVEKLKECAKRSTEQMDVLYRSKLQEYFG